MIAEKIVVNGGQMTDTRFYEIQEIMGSCQTNPTLKITLYASETLSSTREARRLIRMLNSLKNHLESQNAPLHNGVVMVAQTPLMSDDYIINGTP
jgi:hypothetical protein